MNYIIIISFALGNLDVLTHYIPNSGRMQMHVMSKAVAIKHM
jgi:hypothetical protein